MEITFDAEAAATIASAAIFDHMTQETRDHVIKQAVQALLTPETDARGYSQNKKTPLQIAFEQAIRDAAFKAVREKIQNDPKLEAAILELLGPLLKAGIEGEAKEYGSSLANALGDALGVWLSDVARNNSK